MEKLETVCLDTDVIINFLRNKSPDGAYVESLDSSASITIISLFELYFGAYKSGRIENLSAVKSLEEHLKILPLTPDIARIAGEVLAMLQQKGEQMEFRDLLIGIIVRENNCVLKTNNLKHFRKVPGLRLVE